MINIKVPTGNLGGSITATDLAPLIVYRIITVGEYEGCFAVLSEDRDSIVLFGDDNYIDTGSIDWCFEQDLYFLPTNCELDITIRN